MKKGLVKKIKDSALSRHPLHTEPLTSNLNLRRLAGSWIFPFRLHFTLTSLQFLKMCKFSRKCPLDRIYYEKFLSHIKSKKYSLGVMPIFHPKIAIHWKICDSVKLVPVSLVSSWIGKHPVASGRVP